MVKDLKRKRDQAAALEEDEVRAGPVQFDWTYDCAAS